MKKSSKANVGFPEKQRAEPGLIVTQAQAPVSLVFEGGNAALSIQGRDSFEVTELLQVLSSFEAPKKLLGEFVIPETRPKRKTKKR